MVSVALAFWIAGWLAGNGWRHIGVPASPAANIPILGWSMDVGDLRPAQFFALHTMQAVPALGWFAGRYGLSRRAVYIFALLYGSFTVMVFLTALRGVPLISL